MTSGRRFFLLALGTLPGACASPNPTLYTLAAIPGSSRAGAPRNIEVRAISLPRYLERSQIVRSSEGYRLDVLGNSWWGEPLDSMLVRILVEELSQRLPGSTVYNDTGAISAAADATVEINIQRFDLDRQKDVLLLAEVAVEAQRPSTRSVRIMDTPTDAGTPALVAAMSRASASLADTIAMMLATG
jgi:uncharacterized lipoprotein YmbA